MCIFFSFLLKLIKRSVEKCGIYSKAPVEQQGQIVAFRAERSPVDGVLLKQNPADLS